MNSIRFGASRVLWTQVRSFKTLERVIREPKRILDIDGNDITDRVGAPHRPIEPEPKAIIKRGKEMKLKRKIVPTKPLQSLDFLSEMTTILSGKSKKNPSELVALEGERLIRDVMISQPSVIKQVYHVQNRPIESFPCLLQFKDHFKFQAVSTTDMKAVSDVRTPPGIMASCYRPKEVPNAKNLPISLVLSSLRDPGNVGGIIRSAVGAGVKNIISYDSCNLWDRKVVRAGAGAHWRGISLKEVSTFEEMANLIKDIENKRVFFCQNQMSHEMAYNQYHPSSEEETILFIGGETLAYKKEVDDLLDELKAKPVTVPLMNGVDSLNSYVAASIVLYHFNQCLTSDK